MALSPEIKDAANHIQSHAQGMQAVITLAAYVEDIRALEQAASEAENRVKNSEKTEAKLNERIDAAKQRADDAEAAIVADRSAAQEALKKAKADAADLVAKARADGENIVARAQEEARRVLADAKAERQAVIDGIDADIADKRQLQAEENAVLADLRTETADLEDRVRKAKEYIASLKG